MVVFTCEACNESLKKNKVEQHLFRCRRARHVTCIDCQVDFGRESYKAHTACISEMEKYSGPGYVAKASANKGAKKQDDWFQRVQSAIDSCSQQSNSPLSRVLYKVRESSNVPRKQAKFINFCRNSMKWANPTVIQEAWNLLADSAVSASMEEGEEVKEAATTADSKKRPSNSEAEEEPVQKKQNKSELKVDQLESQPDEESYVKKKKTKKNKKDRKLNDDESAAHENSKLREIAPSVSEDAKAEATQEKKKKKKKRQSEPCDEAAQPDADAEQCHENGESLGATQKKKKKRSSEQNESKDAEPIADGAAECGDANAEPIVEGSPEKKSKKKKKRLSSQNGVDEAPLEPEQPAASELPEKMSKKKKKRDSSQNVVDEAPLEPEQPAANELPEKKKKKKNRKRQSTEEDAETRRMTPCNVGLV